jgi:hypothetical protein
LANLGTVHHEAEVFCFNMLSTSLKTVVHSGLQTDLMAMATCRNTGRQGNFNMFWVIHNVLLKVNKQTQAKRTSYLNREQSFGEDRSALQLHGYFR